MPATGLRALNRPVRVCPRRLAVAGRAGRRASARWHATGNGVGSAATSEDSPRANARRPSLFVGTVAALLSACLLALLSINTAVAEDAYRLDDLRQVDRATVDRLEALDKEVQILRAPEALAARALALGMTRGEAPAFMRLPTAAPGEPRGDQPVTSAGNGRSAVGRDAAP